MHPTPGLAHWSVGSIEDVGTRNGCATSTSTASTKAGADDGLLRALVQPLAATTDGGEKAVQIDLERGEHRVGPVLHLEPRLAGLAACLVDDLLGLALGDLHDLRLRGLAHRLLARLGEQPVDLALRFGEHLLALLDDPPRLLYLLGDGRAHLIEDVVDLLLVDPYLVGQGHRLGVMHQVVELVYQYKDIHLSWSHPIFRQRFSSSCKRLATSSGTRSSILPPKVASSLTPLDDRKLY